MKRTRIIGLAMLAVAILAVGIPSRADSPVHAAQWRPAGPKSLAIRAVGYALGLVNEKKGSSVPNPKLCANCAVQQANLDLQYIDLMQVIQPLDGAHAASTPEDCWHWWNTWRVTSDSGTHLYDFRFYVAWCTDRAQKHVTRIMQVSCTDYPDKAHVETACRTGSDAAGASEVYVNGRYQYKSPSTGVSPSYRYTEMIDAHVTAKHTIYGTLTSGWDATYP